MAKSRRTIRRALSAVVAGILAVGAIAISAPAQAALAPGQLAITFVARVCDSYSDVRANKARNNWQESLKDLGGDSPYATSAAVSIAGESNDPAFDLSACTTPLNNWQFTLGSDYWNPRHIPDGQYLSVVQEVAGHDFSGINVTTAASGVTTPVLNQYGQDTGQSIQGAVTHVLTTPEVNWVRQGHPLWIQGGTLTQTLNGMQSQYGFAALRCGQDAVNGDNVEQVSFPSGATHVFCFYYVVSPPPDSGIITVQKALAAGTVAQGAVTVPFQGNISYTPDQTFTLAPTTSAPDSLTFYRAAGTTWNFTENVPDGWYLQGVDCTQTGESTVTAGTPTAPQTSVALAAGDHVTCTYTDALTPPPPPPPAPATVNGELLKATIGNVGTFGFVITQPDGVVATTTVTTEQQGVPVQFAQTPDGGSPTGQYTLVETLPADSGLGHWFLVGGVCRYWDPATPDDTHIDYVGVQADNPDELVYTPHPNMTTSCIVINWFTPGGQLTITKTTQGGTGYFVYSVQRLDDDGNIVQTYQQDVTTTAADTPVETAPFSSDGAGASTNQLTELPVPSRYVVQETLPPPSDAGVWQLVSADCGPNQVTGVSQSLSAFQVALTEDHPHATCNVVNKLLPPGLLQISKTTTRDTGLRPGAATIEYSCGQLASGSFDVAPGMPSNISDDLRTVIPLTCQATESANGAADGVTDDNEATITRNGGDAEPYELGSDFVVGPGDRVQVDIVDTLEAAATPPPTTEPPTDPGTPPGGDLGLSDTGVPIIGGVVAAIMLIGVGALAFALFRRRRTH